MVTNPAPVQHNFAIEGNGVRVEGATMVESGDRTGGAARLCEVAGVPRLSVHQPRHTHTTLLFQDGQNFKIISERLGHSRVGVTLESYVHLAENAQDAAAMS